MLLEFEEKLPFFVLDEVSDLLCLRTIVLLKEFQRCQLILFFCDFLSEKGEFRGGYLEGQVLC